MLVLHQHDVVSICALLLIWAVEPCRLLLATNTPETPPDDTLSDPKCNLVLLIQHGSTGLTHQKPSLGSRSQRPFSHKALQPKRQTNPSQPCMSMKTLRVLCPLMVSATCSCFRPVSDGLSSRPWGLPCSTWFNHACSISGPRWDVPDIPTNTYLRAKPWKSWQYHYNTY